MSLDGDLRKLTKTWTMPVVVRTYEDNSKGEKLLQQEASILTVHAYEPQMQTQDGGHIHAGRLILTGGFSVLAGKRGIRSGGKISITYRKQSADSIAAAAGFDPQGQYVAAWSGINGLKAGSQVTVGLSAFEFALLDSSGRPSFRVPIAEVDAIAELDSGARVWRGQENLVILRPLDGRSPVVLVEALKGRKQPSVAVQAPAAQAVVTATTDIPDQLRKLAELRDSGIVTDLEFEAKKADLLSRM